ncbi:MAG: restriction endonuclease subunit S [Gammaproteobacteria bacterium]
MEQALYKLPDGWKWKKLGDLFDIGSSKRVHQKDWTTEGVPFYRAREVVLLSKNGSVANELFISESMYQSFAAKYGLPEKGDILVTGVGTLGACYVVKENDKFYYKDGNIICLKRKHEEINSRFVEYAFQSSVLKRQVNDSAGAVVATYTISRAKSTDIPFAPVEVQNRIVEKLDALLTRIDTAIEHLQESVTLADALVKSSLSSMLTKHEHWDKVSLSDVCQITSKLCDPREEQYLDLFHVGGANITSFSGELISLKTAREEKLISGKFPFDNSMVLYSKIRPYLMKVARPSISGICSADIYPLTPDNQKMSRDFLFYLLLSDLFTQYAIEGSSRAGMPKVNRNHLFNFEFYLPPIDEQKSICESLDVLVEKTNEVSKELAAKLFYLTDLKASILDSAFKGEL